MNEERMWLLVAALCVPLLVLLTSLWVLNDARAIGVRKGLIRGTGVPDAGPWGWFFGCLFIWIIAFPMYLIYRSRLMKAAREDSNRSKVAKSAGPVAMDFDDELRRLARLRDEGLITAAEFDTKKKALLGL